MRVREMLHYFALFILLLNLCFVENSTDSEYMSCKDETGNDVDWFYIYKLPKHYNSKTNMDWTEESPSNGLNYMYITSDDFIDWKFSSTNIRKNDSMLALTLSPIFEQTESTLLIAYNDEFPNGTYVSKNGHTKGVVATNGEAGIWLIHSVPKFPTIPIYDYPITGERYGQSFLCLTLSGNDMNKVGEQLLYNEPNIYYSHIPSKLKSHFPNLEDAISNKWRTIEPFNNLLNLGTKFSHTEFVAFAKGGQFQKELYEDWVAPELDVSLFVETWRNGHGNLLSNCSTKNEVYNINEIAHKKLGISFKTTSDHSKWCVSKKTGYKFWRWRFGGSEDWICVGDINRQEEQQNRGGGTVCQKNEKVAQLYRNLISKYDKC